MKPLSAAIPWLFNILEPSLKPWTKWKQYNFLQQKEKKKLLCLHSLLSSSYHFARGILIRPDVSILFVCANFLTMF